MVSNPKSTFNFLYTFVIQVLNLVIDALTHEDASVRTAACICLRSVSRSIKVCNMRWRLALEVYYASAMCSLILMKLCSEFECRSFYEWKGCFSFGSASLWSFYFCPGILDASIIFIFLIMLLWVVSKFIKGTCISYQRTNF